MNRLRLPGPLAARLVVWCLVFILFPLSVTAVGLSFRAEVLGAITFVSARTATPEPLRLDENLSGRVLARLEDCERTEIDPWLRDDFRIAWITVLFASRGNLQPHVDATYRVLGLHPEKVWPAMMERRKAICGRLYEEVWGGASSPKKPQRSVSLDEARGRGEAA
jgi:hypothetical protein